MHKTAETEEETAVELEAHKAVGIKDTGDAVREETAIKVQITAHEIVEDTACGFEEVAAVAAEQETAVD